MQRIAIARRLGEAQALEPPEQDRRRASEFEPSQRRADAEMYAGPETRRRVRRPGRAETVGFRKALRIAVRAASRIGAIAALSRADRRPRRHRVRRPTRPGPNRARTARR